MTSRALTIAVGVMLVAVLALGGYVLHLKRSAEQAQAHLVDTKPIAPPVAGPPTRVTLAVANDADGSLTDASVSVQLPKDVSKRPKEVLRALVNRYLENGSTHPLGAGADINEVYVVNGNLAVVDVNAAFADGHRSGILVEELTLASMAETLSANVSGVTQMKLLVDGKERPTLAGHADLTEPYDAAAAATLVQR
jgi:sporulation and spore germination protein